ncbi:hypothetical protein BJ123_1428 [Rhodopseudomonas thermotolerans]|uniref:Uncharacterized protein n=2 Tax=Rhodopseudomonas TaxID=1073 RepID=A0A336JYQ6_9BRAD|nr:MULTISPECIES: hypothetical protein [Rhodopseudomonas]RED22218.1 hypothetical protein BJ125_1428 [Rhodopseudomonas pentothenatexigens]REF88676.1 hypothetical protein BJ123_1428 [Rhodopseudomonas thermotolerans]SSW93546.1 hypothetical protein SAMN05892882_1428 [Rhodopseudomonas pentothenatexigens]
MQKLFQALNLKGNPFEHYVAETEPNIAEYAVQPPYFQEIKQRAQSRSTYVLFGDRGAGKSATRLTIYKELWKAKSANEEVPLAVNIIDFSSVVQGKSLQGVSEAALIKEVAFAVIESLLTWLSSLSDDDRSIYLEATTKEENDLCYALLRDYYLNRPEAKRSRSVREAMHLLNQAFYSGNKLWVEQRWDRVATLVGAIAEGISARFVGVGGVGKDAASLLAGNSQDGFDSVLTLQKLIDLVRIFGFSGIVALVDKVDETEATTNSADQTASLVYPLLSRVQLMEIPNFSWVFFLWNRLKAIFEGAGQPVRLDKIGHATVSWSDDFLSLMLENRLRYYSEKRYGFEGLFTAETDVDAVKAEVIRVAMRSPREAIRLMDVILREHDITHLHKNGPELLDDRSVEIGLNTYATDVVTATFGERLLAQIFRLNKTSFTNKDVQNTFRTGSQSARTRIQSWENAGIVRLSGTRTIEGAIGRPVNEYTIVDARVERVMRKQLIAYYDPVVEEPEFVLEGDSDSAPG